jgi:hydrogenase/urease accessory protein HupE
MQASLRTLTVLMFALAPAPGALAHDPGLSALTLHQLGNRVEFSVVVNHADLAADRRATAPRCSAAGVLSVKLDGRDLPIDGSCRLRDAQHTAFEGWFSVPQAAELSVRLGWFDELPRGHRCFARLLDARAAPIARGMLTRESEPLRARVGVPASWEFLVLGVEHIVTGYDHLLFLLVLLLGVDSLRRMAALVSCFTLAHSSTLALAALGLIGFPSSLVEAAIAASIVCVALRNLLAHVPPIEYLTATFGFGLVHGLGFASGLRELGVAGSGLSVIPPLVQFNLGVELGQIGVGALTVPCLLWLRRCHGSLAAMRALSGGAAAVGLFWFVQRVSSL